MECNTYRLWFGLVILLVLFKCQTTLAKPGQSNGFQFLKKPFHFKGVEFGTTFAFDCRTNGKNVTSALYFQKSAYHKLVQVTNQTWAVSVNKDIYNLSNIGIRKAGFYRCMATNGRGQTIKWPLGYGLVIPYKVRSPKLAISPDYLVHLTSGESQNFTCQSSSSVTNLTWYRIFVPNHLRPIAVSNTVVVRDTAKNIVQNILTITNARKADSGIFKCVSNFRGKQRIKFAALQVHEQLGPVILSQTSSLDIVSPKKAQLECTIQGHPRPKVTWYKGNKPITIPGCDLNAVLSCHGNDEYGMWIRRTGKHEKYRAILVIKKTKYPTHQGLYRCMASNAHGKVEASISVTVKAKPVLSKTSSSITFSGKAKSPFVVRCNLKTQSNPPSRFTWELQPFWNLNKTPDLKNNWIPLPSCHIIRPLNGSTTCNAEAYIMRAFYRCTASNIVGRDTHVIKYVRFV